MTQVAVAIPEINQSVANTDQPITKTYSSRDMVILCLVMSVLQIGDGILTGIGVARFGTHAEGNMIIKYAMDSIGYIPALILIKGFALVVIAGLFSMSPKVSWLPQAFKAVIAIYLGAAIIPWTYALLVKGL